MATTQRPVVGVFDKDTGALTGFATTGGVEVQNAFLTSAAGSAPRQVPWKISTFGTSRVNAGSATPAVAGDGVSIRIDRALTWACALRGDIEIVRNYGLSGGLVRPNGTNGFLLSNRSESKTLAACIADDVDAVILDADIINDLTGWDAVNPSATTMQNECIAILKETLLRLVLAGKRVLVTPGMQSSASGYGVNPTLKRDIFNNVKASIQTYAESLSPQVVWFDEATMTATPDGYFDQVAWGIDYGHYEKTSARRSAVGGWIGSLDKLLPRRNANMFVNTALSLQSLPNMVNMITPSTSTGIDTNGTATAVAVTTGVDAGEPYIEFVYTPLTLQNGECKMRLQINANVGSFGGATPEFTVASGDVVQAGARVLLDNNSGGVANVYNFQGRIRNYKQAGGFTVSDWGAFIDPAATPTLVGGKLGGSGPLGFRFAAVRHTLDVASSGIEAPAFGKGLALHIVLQSSVIDGQPIRCRVYTPWLAKVA